MNIIEIIQQSFDSLRGNKLRSFLTMLGIIMGVFSLIAIVATGNAIKVYINTEFEKIGSNTVSVFVRGNEPDSYGMQIDDIEIVKQAVPNIKSIAPYLSTRGGSIRVEEKTRVLVLNGVTAEARNQGSIDIVSGRYISDADVKARADVCLINETLANQVFKRTDVVGEKLFVKGRSGVNLSLVVVGVINSEIDSLSSMFGDEAPVNITVPLSTAMSISNNKDISDIRFIMEENANLRDAGLAAVKAIEFVRGLKDEVQAQNSDDILTQLNNILSMVQIALGVIAAITLAVGGIGIVNIMLVSVTERTREIGIRKAIGAQKRDIVLQFVAEAVMMTGISGLIGIAMGVGVGSIISAVINIPPVVDIQTIVLSFMFSLVLGLGFGVYPAKRAADLDPIESLRYE